MGIDIFVYIQQYTDADDVTNRKEDERYIVDLIGKIITVSLETMKIIYSFPDYEEEVRKENSI